MYTSKSDKKRFIRKISFNMRRGNIGQSKGKGENGESRYKIKIR